MSQIVHFRTVTIVSNEIVVVGCFKSSFLAYTGGFLFSYLCLLKKKHVY